LKNDKNDEGDADAYILAAVEEGHYALLAKDLTSCLATITECEKLRGILNDCIDK
jgi:hypothetical protein